MNEAARRALDDLLRGNERYAGGRPAHPRGDAGRRAETAGGQRPFAAVVSCSDSRVPPEILFDQGIGDLFVVRTAGGVLDDAAIGSLEYAVEHLRVPLLVVLGHTRCGAVEAAIAGGRAPGRIARLVEALRPAVERASSLGGDQSANAVRACARASLALLAACGPIIAPRVADGSLELVGAVYDVATGIVAPLDSPGAGRSG